MRDQPSPPASASATRCLFASARHLPFAAAIGLLSLIQTSPMSSSASRGPKRKIYHRVPALDKAIDLQKKPAALLRLRSLIAARHPRPLLLRDLEQDLGLVDSWNLLSLIQRYPSVFSTSPGAVSLTAKAQLISSSEPLARQLMQPILIKNLRKLLMMSLDCQIPLEKIDLIAPDLGLPDDYKNSLLSNHPNFFSIRSLAGVDHLCLEGWDSSLAVTAREARLDHASTATRQRIAKDGNYPGPFAFQMRFSPGFRPNLHYLEELQRWQRMEFPSPYLNVRKIEVGTPVARKRAVAVLHEILSLTMEKRLAIDKLDTFHREYKLPTRLLLCLVKSHGIFYITNKGARSTVFLKEAYDGSRLIEKCPLLLFSDRFASLIGRTSPDLSNAVTV